MSHPNQIAFVAACATLLARQLADASVVEIGSYDVNGNIRAHFAWAKSHTGIDLVAGPGVDIVDSGHEFGTSNAYDIAISCEAFEHNPYWLETFLNMIRITRPGGVVLFTCASKGRAEHGTERTGQADSPGTSSVGWAYYKNLDANDFTRRIDLGRHFEFHRFYRVKSTRDLYFIGIKREYATAGQSSGQPTWLQREIEGLDRLIAKINATPPVPSSGKHPILNAIRMLPVHLAERTLPDRLYQDFRFHYIKRTNRLKKMPAGRIALKGAKIRMRISIAMATYNGAKYLQEQLDSLAAQTLLPCELVICDDGSTDATLEIAERFAATAPFPVRIHRNEKNLGYADNFLKAASLCEGDWIAFCDQDDVWLPHKLETVSRRFDQEVLLVIHSADVVDQNLTPGTNQVLQLKSGATKKPLTNRTWWTPPGFTQCISRKLAALPYARRPKDFNYPDRMQAHDQWFYFLANSMGRVTYIRESLVKYRRHDTTVTATSVKPETNSLWQKITVTDEKHYALLAGIAYEYKKAIWNLMPLMDRATALRAISYYNRLRLFQLARSLIYSQADFIVRARALLRIALRKGYFGGATAGLGARALAKDVFMLFLASPISLSQNLLRRALLARSLFFKKAIAHLPPSADFPPGSALVVAPHPDDEVFACGGLIARKLDRKERVDILYMTQGEASHVGCCGIDKTKIAIARKQLAEQALNALGDSEVKTHWLNLPDDGVPPPDSDRFDEAIARVAQIIDDIKPEQIFMPHALDTHSDHINTNAIVTAALKGRDVSVFCYPTWMLHRFRRQDLFRRVSKRIFKLDITPSHARKMSAIAIYESMVDPTCPIKAPIIGMLPDTLVREFKNDYEIFIEAA